MTRPRDRDRSGEAGETALAGSTEGKSPEVCENPPPPTPALIEAMKLYGSPPTPLEEAERQLAEARAALRDVVHAFTGSIAQLGGNASWNPAVVKAIALLSGETT